jgi:hypothetical protein
MLKIQKTTKTTGMNAIISRMLLAIFDQLYCKLNYYIIQVNILNNLQS